MNDYIAIILLALTGGLFSLAGALVLLGKRFSTDKLINYVTPFAAGALLAAVFLDLLHEGLEKHEPYGILLAALTGVIVFFYAERFLRWFHHHHQHGGNDPVTNLVLIGDTIHNALDGIAIAAAYLVDPSTGIVTTAAVAAHEIPQEIGDFGILLSKGKSRRFVLVANILSSLSTVLAAVLTYALGSGDRLPVGPLIGISAGFLLYIAASDIIPTIHEQVPKHRLIDWQSLMVLVGALSVAAVITVSHGFLEG